MATRVAQWKKLLNDPYTGEMLFWSGFIMHLGRSVWETTMFPYPGRLSQAMLLLPAALILLKIIFYDAYTIKELCLVIPAGIIVSITCISSGYLGSGLWLLVILGCKNIPFDKILKVYVIVTGAICALAFAASLLGVIENLAYYNSNYGGYRYSFGIIYCTDCAAHVFFLVLILYYLGWKQLKFWHIAGTAALAGIVYYFCRARLDSICILITAVLFGLDHFLRQGNWRRGKLSDQWRWMWKWMGNWAFPILAAAFLAMTICYRPASPALKTVDRILSSRLSLGKQGIEQYGIHLLGQQIEMQGMGGTTDKPEKYFFLDCSYVNILLRLGILFFSLLVFLYFKMAYKRKRDTAFMMALAIVALNCAIAHHLMEIAYNPFACALFAESALDNKSEKPNIPRQSSRCPYHHFLQFSYNIGNP